MRTSSTSPGIAPLISIGPVSTCPEGPRSFTSRNMSRWYCGIALGGTTPDWSMISGANNDDVSIATVSPDSMLSTGFRLDAKCPMCTDCRQGLAQHLYQATVKCHGQARGCKNRLRPLVAQRYRPASARDGSCREM